MEKYSLDGAILSVFFDTRRAKNVPENEEVTERDLRYPVKYRIFSTADEKYYFHPSGIDLTEDEWKLQQTQMGKNF